MAMHDDFELAHNDGFCMSEEMISLQVIARCAECIGRTAPKVDDAGNVLTDEQSAHLQWVRCAQCRCGTHDWYKG